MYPPNNNNNNKEKNDKFIYCKYIMRNETLNQNKTEQTNKQKRKE